MAQKSRVARGGTIHPIATAPIKDGERFDALLSPGAEDPWENGYSCPETRYWLRRDGERLYPTHWSPLPGQTVKL
jgi:hypothetical protein